MSRPSLRSLAVGCAWAFAACSGSNGAAPSERPNIVLITIDTLRADHLGCYGYFRETSPRIDALAKESVVFDQAYATMATTLPSHSSMFTARFPLEHGILANLWSGGRPFGWKKGMLSFAEVARDAGYATAGFVSCTPLGKHTGISTGFDTWSEPEHPERRAGDTLEPALAWLRGAHERPYFLWIHFYDPHRKHSAPPPFDKLFHSDAPDPRMDEWIAARGLPESLQDPDVGRMVATRVELDAYCGEVRYADSQVGLLLDELAHSGELERSIVVLASDHGEGLNQHDWAAHGLVWDEQLRVPLMMRFPKRYGIAPQRSPRLVSLVDLFPTVLARAPLGTSEEHEFLAQASGVDVLAPGFVERPLFGQRSGREFANDPGEMLALTSRDWKYIHEPGVGDRLFDRRADPFELHDLAAREPAQLQSELAAIEELKAMLTRRGEALGSAEAGPVDPKALEDIQKLGYGDGLEPDEASKAPPEKPRVPGGSQ